MSKEETKITTSTTKTCVLTLDQIRALGITFAPIYKDNLLEDFFKENKLTSSESAPALGALVGVLQTWKQNCEGLEILMNPNNPGQFAIFTKGAGIGVYEQVTKAPEVSYLFKRKVFYCIVRFPTLFRDSNWYILGFSGCDQTDSIQVTTKQYFVCHPFFDKNPKYFLSRSMVCGIMDAPSVDEACFFREAECSFLEQCHATENSLRDLSRSLRSSNDRTSHHRNVDKSDVCSLQPLNKRSRAESVEQTEVSSRSYCEETRDESKENDSAQESESEDDIDVGVNTSETGYSSLCSVGQESEQESAPNNDVVAAVVAAEETEDEHKLGGIDSPFDLSDEQFGEQTLPDPMDNEYGFTRPFYPEMGEYTETYEEELF